MPKSIQQYITKPYQSEEIKRIIKNGGLIMSVYSVIKKNKDKMKANKIIKSTYSILLRALFALEPAIPLSFTIKLYYYIGTGKWIDFESPRDFNEKIQWLKVYYRDPLYIKCADKYTVREYVKKCGCGNTLNELYAVYDNESKIDFEALPNRFAMKCVHGCGSNLICDDKTKLNYKVVKKQFGKWLSKKIGNVSGEKHYNLIKPRIIVEKNLVGDDGILPIDYKFYCFNGVPKCVCVFADRGTVEHGTTRCYFDLEWNWLDYCTTKYKTSPERFKKPESLEQMIKTAEMLAKPFPFVRVDLYQVEGKVVFGELTFTPAGGKSHAYNETCHKHFCDYLKLPERSKSRKWTIDI